MKPKIIHTKTFSCGDDHPIVWYTVDKENKGKENAINIKKVDIN